MIYIHNIQKINIHLELSDTNRIFVHMLLVIAVTFMIQFMLIYHNKFTDTQI